MENINGVGVDNVDYSVDGEMFEAIVFDVDIFSWYKEQLWVYLNNKSIVALNSPVVQYYMYRALMAHLGEFTNEGVVMEDTTTTIFKTEDEDTPGTYFYLFAIPRTVIGKNSSEDIDLHLGEIMNVDAESILYLSDIVEDDDFTIGIFEMVQD